MEAVKKTLDVVAGHGEKVHASERVLTPPREEIPPLPVGTVLLGRYMLMRLIAQGGTSYIYRARDMVAVLGRDDEQSHIAIKVVGPLEDDQAERQLMLYEALTTRHLSHPNIIKIYDFHRDGKISFVTMELIAGESLAEYLLRAPNKKLPYRQGMAILRASSQALQAAHEQGVVHSDVKPSNILLTDDGNIKVIDFATARACMGLQGGPDKFVDESRFYGYTLAYASPQTIADEPARPSDDVFSLACITYELLSGRHPFQRKASNSAEAAALTLKKPAEIGWGQWWVLKRALVLDANRRLQSVATFVRLFSYARWLWTSIVLCVLSLALLIVGIGALGEKITTDRAQAALHAQHYQQQREINARVAEVRALPPLQRAAHLAMFDSAPDLLREGALGELRPAVVDPLVAHVSEALNYNEGLPDFDALLHSVERTLGFYPDSASLRQALTALEAEKNQLLNSLTVQSRQAWATTEFSADEAEVLLGLRENLRALNRVNLFTPGQSVIESYGERVGAAVKANDFLMLASLYRFADILSSQDFLKAWNGVDAELPLAAVALSNYLGSWEANPDLAYPLAAVPYFVEPVLNDVNKAIEAARLDTEIYAARESFDAAVRRFGLRGNVEAYQQSRNALINKLETKLIYHEQQGNNRSLQRMQQALDELKAEGNPDEDINVRNDSLRN